MVTSIKTLTFTSITLAVSSSLPAMMSFTAGHGDIGVEFDGTDLELHYHLGEDGESYTLDGTPFSMPDGEEFEPDEIKVVVPNSSTAVALSAPIDTTPTGAADGETYFIIPDTFTAGVPFLGFSVEELDPAEWDGALTFSLVSVTGPGEFSVFNSVVPGPDFLMATADGIDAADLFSADPDLEVEEHQHFNIGFTEEGTYEVELMVEGTLTGGGTVSDSATFTFQVVPEPSVFGLGAGLAAIFSVIWRRRLVRARNRR